MFNVRIARPNISCRQIKPNRLSLMETSATLVIGPSWIGDMVIAQSMFMVMHMCNPSRSIDVVAPAWSAPLLARMPEVRDLVDLQVGHGELGLRKRFRLSKQLRSKQYESALILPNSYKSALLPWLTAIRKRTGYRGEYRYGLINDMRPFDPAKMPALVQRFVALAMEKGNIPSLDDCPVPRLRVDQQARVVALEALGLSLEKPILALCPGAEYGRAKRWPPAHYAAVARYFRARGYQIWVFGGPNDREITRLVCEDAGPECIDLAGKTTLEQAIDLLSLSSVVVTNDSGLMHIAAAVDVPIVAIYGSSDPVYTPPLSTKSRIERLNLFCSPCFKRDCPLKHFDCLRGVHPDRVIHIIEDLLVQAA